MMWRSGELPPRGSRFVALFADGGGAELFYLDTAGVLFDAHGEELLRGSDRELADFLFDMGFFSWTELPEGMRLFFEEAGE